MLETSPDIPHGRVAVLDCPLRVDDRNADRHVIYDVRQQLPQLAQVLRSPGLFFDLRLQCP